jgi:hypothetical protein
LERTDATLNSYSEAGLSSLKEAAIISVIDVAASTAVSLVLRFVLTDVLGLILLLEGAVLLLIGGALGFAGQAGVRRLMTLYRKEPTRLNGGSGREDGTTQVKLADITAAFYMSTGMVLFLESITMALLLQ